MKRSQFKPNCLPPSARGLGFLKSQDGDHVTEARRPKWTGIRPCILWLYPHIEENKNPSDP
jgi:hypothetical protein